MTTHWVAGKGAAVSSLWELFALYLFCKGLWAHGEPPEPHPPFPWEDGGHAVQQGFSHADSTCQSSESQAQPANKMHFKRCERAQMRCSGAGKLWSFETPTCPS